MSEHLQQIWFLDTIVLHWTRDDQLYVSYGYQFRLVTPSSPDIHAQPHEMGTEYRFQLVRSQTVIDANYCIVRSGQHYVLPQDVQQSIRSTREMLDRLGEVNPPVVPPTTGGIGATSTVDMSFGDWFKYKGPLPTFASFCLGASLMLLWNSRHFLLK